MRKIGVAIGVLVAALCLADLSAQDSRAKVQGLITDSSHAVVVGANVTLRNRNTGVVTVKQSNQTGKYLFDYVDAGEYEITVEYTGFSKAVQENVPVRVRGDVTVNMALKPGAVLETVTVSETPVAVQFNTSSMVLPVGQQMLNNLPFLSRSPFQATTLNPAIRGDEGGRSYAPIWMWTPGGADFGGQTSGKNDLLIDGAPVIVGSKGSYTPPIDASQELVIQQNSVDAEFGHSSGGVLSLTTKSGTNEVHGTASYYGRNPALNASINSVVHSVNGIHSSIWGGSLGGPIIKNKLFTYGAWEQNRSAEPKFYSSTQPTDLQRAGDFSQSLNSKGGLLAIYNPWSTIFDPATGKVTRTPFPGNRIPVTQMDRTSVRIMKDSWSPNGPGDDQTGVNNYRTTFPLVLNFKNFTDRTDWNISDKWKVFGRYSRWSNHAMPPNFANARGLVVYGSEKRARNIAGDTVYMLTPATVLNFRGSFGSLQDDYANHATGTVTMAEMEEFWLGNPWYKSYYKDLPIVYYPNVNIENGGTIGKGGYYWDHPRTYSFSGRISHEKGRHYLKAGLELRRHGSDPYWPKVQSFNFQQALTADTFLPSQNTGLSGNGYATFLLGAMGSDSWAEVIPPQHMGMWAYAGYFHDDFKLNRRLTLNLGLRYEHEGAPFAPGDPYSRYLDLTEPIPEMQSNPPKIPTDVAAMMKTPYAFNGAWVFSDSSQRGAFRSSKLSFMPRIGLALRINDKTALRAGWARYIVPPVMLPSQMMHQGLQTPGFSQRTNVLPVLEGIPGGRLSDPFPASNPLIQPVGKSLGRYTNLGNEARWFQDLLKTGVNDRINISLERQMPARIVVGITYFMNFGYNGQYDKQLNLSDPALSYTYQAALSKTVANPFYHYLTPEKFPGQLRNQETVSIGSLLVPYPQYGSLYTQSADGVVDRYHALQISAERPFSKGFSMLVAYNYNRESSSGFFNADDDYAKKFTMIGSGSGRHRMKITDTYELPVGRGRTLLPNAHPLVNAILGGWSVSSILGWFSGDLIGFGQMIVDGNPKIDNPSPAKWFDTSKFKVPRPFTPRTNPLNYPGLRGPRFWNLDGSLSKYFPIKERFRLEFKLEAYNLSNAFVPGGPNTDVRSSLFGRSTNLSGTYLSQRNYGREVQYALKLYF